MGTPDNKILVNAAWAVDGIIRCGIAEKPVTIFMKTDIRTKLRINKHYFIIFSNNKTIIFVAVNSEENFHFDTSL